MAIQRRCHQKRQHGYLFSAMNLKKPIIPKGLDADVAMSVVIPQVDTATNKKVLYSFEFKGVSERTSLGDNLGISVRNRQNNSSVVKFSLKRDSLYHILPEYLFHPLDHYLGTDGDTEEFDKRYKDQEEQKNNALTYFKPFDRQFQQLRISFQRWLNENIFSGNQFVADFITEGYEVNKNNPYINAVYPCIYWIRSFRGNDDMIRTALGYAFAGNASIVKEHQGIQYPISAEVPCTIDCYLDEIFCGATYNNWKNVWSVFFQTEIKSEQHLSLMKEQLREFSLFFSSWFLSVEDEIFVEFGDRLVAPILQVNTYPEGIYLNYSTQLI